MTFTDEHGGVTDTDLEAYIQQRMGQSPLAPVVPGQSQTTPPFRPGVGAPPPGNVDETAGSADDSTFAASDLPTESPETEIEEVPGTDHQDDDETSEETTQEPSEETAPESPVPGPISDAPPALQLDPDRLQALLELDTLIRHDAALRSKVEGHLRERDGGQAESGGASQPATPTPSSLPVIPQDVLESDPAIAALYSLAQSQQETLRSYGEQLNHTSQVVFDNQRQETQQIVTRISERFAKDKGLSQDEVNNLGIIVSRTNLLTPLTNGTDPVTGESVPIDREFAVQRALDIAYWSVPEYRDREYASKLQQRSKDQQRKQKLAGIGGSSGSVPRTVPIPTDEYGRRQAAIRELAESMETTRE